MRDDEPPATGAVSVGAGLADIDVIGTSQEPKALIGRLRSASPKSWKSAG